MVKYKFVKSDTAALIKELGKERLVEALKKMLLIRNFETRAEAAYQQGKVGGFFHSSIGQEAIGTAATMAIGLDSWYAQTYRCHAIALLHNEPPNELMAELYGKETGNAKGRGGSMHLYSKHLLGGFGIVGGHLPVIAGAAFSLKYRKEKERVAIGFCGDGAMVQGAFHESLNLATLWELPAIFVIENNQWGMGTAVKRAVCNQPIAENFSKGYGIKGYSIDGMDFFNCYAGFHQVYEEVKKTSKPILVEVVTERFKGHSISDPGLYRSKEELTEAMAKDSIHKLSNELIEAKILTQEDVDQINQEQKAIVMDALKFAEESPFPSEVTIGEGVYADS